MSAKAVESKPVDSGIEPVHIQPRPMPVSGRSAVPPTSMLATEHLVTHVRQMAQQLSEIRRIEGAYRDLYNQILQKAKEIPSTAQEMEEDWQDAWALSCLRIIEGSEVNFTQIRPDAYPYFEAVWLKHVKELKAYYIWKTSGTDEPMENYTRASAEIRQGLLERERASELDFERVKNYLQEQYLMANDAARLDECKVGTQLLIARKARRIYEATGETDERTNWFRARLYTAMFYENIIGAVLDNNEQKTRTILKAFEFSKAPGNRYLIINGFETAVATYFLDKKAVRHVLDHPEWYDFSMEPLSDWPEVATMPAGLRFDRDNRQLIFEGLMTDEDKAHLLSQLTEERHRTAVERLCQQSRLQPFKDQVL